MNKKLVSLTLFILISHLVTFSLADERGKVFSKIKEVSWSECNIR